MISNVIVVVIDFFIWFWFGWLILVLVVRERDQGSSNGFKIGADFEPVCPQPARVRAGNFAT
jgi:hypothetical protein